MKRLTVLLLLLATVAAATAAPRKVTARAEKVTLFLDGAQVTRTRQLDLPAGQTTVIFTGLSPWLDEKSLQVAARGEFTVTAVERRFDYSDSLARNERLARIETERKELARRRAETESAREVAAAEAEMLKTNCSVAHRTEVTPLAAIRELTDYYTSRLNALKARSRELDEQTQALDEQQARLDRTLRELLGGQKRQPVSEVVVQVEAPAACRASFRLTYYTGGAGWYPTYDVRSAGLNAPVGIAYRANVYQNTREEWSEVELTLSSSNPSTGSVAPQLRPYRLDYGLSAPRYDSRIDGSEVSGTVVDTRGEPVIGASVTVPGSTVGTATDIDGRFAITLPDGADRLHFAFVGMQPQTRYVTPGSSIRVRLEENAQLLEEVVVTAYAKRASRPLMASATAAPEAEAYDTEADTSMARDVEHKQTPMGYEFEIRRPYTIPADGKSVTVEIGRYELPAVYLYRCAPRADRDAFLSASVTGWEALNLLEGEASVYFENTFVGKSILSPAIQRDTLDFTLGRDRGIVVSRTRENYYKSLRTIGSSQTQEVAWRISVRNTRSESVSLELSDQIPVSSNDAITVTVEELSGGRTDSGGIVTWQLTLAPGQQRDLLLRYKVKYPKNRTLVIE